MKVLAVNSSARVGRESKTERMLLPLVEGMRDAGAEVEMVNLARKMWRTVSDVSPAGPRRRARVSIRTT